MYIELLTGGQKIMALVDSGVTHNFILTRETTKLDLKLAKDDSNLKAVNSQAHKTHVLTKNVAIKMGDWKGTIDLVFLWMILTSF